MVSGSSDIVTSNCLRLWTRLDADESGGQEQGEGTGFMIQGHPEICAVWKPPSVEVTGWHEPGLLDVCLGRQAWLSLAFAQPGRSLRGLIPNLNMKNLRQARHSAAMNWWSLDSMIWLSTRTIHQRCIGLRESDFDKPPGHFVSGVLFCQMQCAWWQSW